MTRRWPSIAGFPGTVEMFPGLHVIPPPAPKAPARRPRKDQIQGALPLGPLALSLPPAPAPIPAPAPAPPCAPAADLSEAARLGRLSALTCPWGARPPEGLSEAAGRAWSVARIRRLARQWGARKPDLGSLAGYANRTARRKADH